MITQFDKFNRGCALFIISLFVVLCMTSKAGARELVTETETISIPAEANMVLRVENLAGDLRVEPASGNKIEVEITRSAGAESQAAAEGLLARLKLERNELRDGVELVVRYPVAEHRSYQYPVNGGHKGSSNTKARYQGRKIQIGSRSRRDAIVLFADFVIRMPNDLSLRFDTVAGRLRVNGVRGQVKLDVDSGSIESVDTAGRMDADTGSGSIKISKHDGSARGDTGSGSVTVEDVTGDVLADTGSGSIAVRRVTGDVDADTGSGNILIEDVVADEIRGDTGSGAVRLRHCTGSIYADTGSGSVEATGHTAGSEIWVDTGSGSVRIDGDLGRVRRLSVDTGSGSITLRTSSVPSLMLQAEQGNGKPRIDLPGLSDVRHGEDWLRARIGSGEGRADLDTGSGSITFEML